MDPMLALEELASGAESHARQEHGERIGSDGVAAADRVLEAELRRGDPSRFEGLAAAYGAWLGRLAVLKWNARWVGLSEPVAPRILLGGVLASPFDAVRRRLLEPGARSLQAVTDEFERWARPGDRGAALNREAWDRLADDARFAGPAPLPPDPHAALDEWVRAEGVRGKAVLCLGAGGGRQGPLLAAAGARVTVVDFSERQLDHDRRAARTLGLTLTTVTASIDDLGALAPSSFDLVVQPVSACYVADVDRVYREVARVLRPGGAYIVQHKQPASLQAGEDLRLATPSVEGASLPASGGRHREPGVTEFLHTLDALLGGLCRAGFVIEEVMEPPRADALAPEGEAGHREFYLPPYLKLKARRR